MSGVNGAPESVQYVLSEVAGIDACIGQLQAFLLGTREVPRSRASMLMVEQVVVTLTGCVTAFLDLQRTLTPMKASQSLRVMDKVRWAMKEQSLGKILGRLQTAKASLNLMLTTLTW